jgi:glycosyltransferase involved in cell wall biosynthesis
VQETNLDFAIVILEDCSTDATRDIVIAYQKKHPDKIWLRLAERNECSNKPFAEGFQAARTPYIAVQHRDKPAWCSLELFSEKCLLLHLFWSVEESSSTTVS